jgi:scaffold attachment factor B1
MASDPEFSASNCSKRLVDLRVIDLRNELEKRGLDKSGNKAALIERLSKVSIN